MIPHSLTIEGLYSYQNRQTIDFAKLTASGLFGIFGNVGSGKSSILEAISYALYGETERLNAKEKRHYNMLNLKCNKSYIAFEFYNYQNDLYKAVRETRRNSKNYTDVSTTNVAFYKWENNDWTPLQVSKAEEIIGLSYENFKRTIIIPQGQFKEFLELKPTERTQMLKSIFQLERFDLSEKVKKHYSTAKTNLDQIEGQLKAYEMIDEDLVAEKKVAWEQAALQHDAQEKRYLETNQHFHLLEKLKADADLLKAKKEEQALLQAQLPAIKELEAKINIYESVYNSFYQPLVSLKTILKNTEIKTNELQEQNALVNQLAIQLQEQERALEAVAPYYHILAQKRLEEQDWATLIQIYDAQQKLAQVYQTYVSEQAQYQSLYTQYESQQQTYQTEYQALQDLKTHKIDLAQLQQLALWYQQYDVLVGVLQDSTEQLQAKKNQYESVQQRILSQNVAVANRKQWYEQELALLKEQSAALQYEMNTITIQNQIAQYAHEIKDGEPCPLCGALEHPQLASVKDSSTTLSILQEKQRTVAAQEKALLERFVLLEQLANEAETLIAAIKLEEEKIATQQAKIQAWEAAFHFEGFSIADRSRYTRLQEEAKHQEATIRTHELQVENQRLALERFKQQLDQFKSKLDHTNLSIVSMNTAIATHTNTLKVLKLDEHMVLDRLVLVHQYESLQSQNVQIETNYKQINEQFQLLKPQYASAQTHLDTTRLRIAELEAEKMDLDRTIAALLAQHHLSDINAAREVLKWQIDVAAERVNIQSFHVKLDANIQIINDLEEFLSQKSFSDADFLLAKETYTLAKQKLDEYTQLKGEMKAQLEHVEAMLHEKNRLLSESMVVIKKHQNLKLLANLFQSAGFVNFVSTIYLKQLCNHANVRFHRMTRNQLSLQINEQNEFEIIDYLNEGKSRSVKTLSGGQAFQVSLSLALALAESVQQHAALEKNFFFIDEGFGTQDSEAVHVVLETLQHLQKENRIVGIISHVEELKEQMPMAINVTKDEVTGSRIDYLSA